MSPGLAQYVNTVLAVASQFRQTLPAITVPCRYNPVSEPAGDESGDSPTAFSVRSGSAPRGLERGVSRRKGVSQPVCGCRGCAEGPGGPGCRYSDRAAFGFPVPGRLCGGPGVVRLYPQEPEPRDGGSCLRQGTGAPRLDTEPCAAGGLSGGIDLSLVP